MLKPQGFGQWTDPGADRPLSERDSISCGHCGRVVYVKPGFGSRIYLIQYIAADGTTIWWNEEPGAGCKVCMRDVCLRCYDLGRCTPLEAFLEEMEGTPRRLLVGVSR